MRMPSVKADIGGGEGADFGRLGAHDLIAGYGGVPYGVIAGFFAGALLWVPVFGILFFNRFLLYASGAQTGVYGGNLGLQPVDLIPYIAATGLFGSVLAVLRRMSARIGWYKEIANQRLGLNDVVATVAGALICIGLIASGSQAGIILMFISIGVLFGGFMVNAAWEAVHNWILTPYAGSRSDTILTRAVTHQLLESKHFKPKELQSVKVERGKVTLNAVWENDDVRLEAKSALQALPGITMVQFERRA